MHDGFAILHDSVFAPVGLGWPAVLMAVAFLHRVGFDIPYTLRNKKYVQRMVPK